MNTKDTGGPAFPRPAVFTEVHGLASVEQDGMTLRDYFAAHAPEPPDRWRGGDCGVDDIIEWRWHYADRMMKARSK